MNLRIGLSRLWLKNTTIHIAIHGVGKADCPQCDIYVEASARSEAYGLVK